MFVLLGFVFVLCFGVFLVGWAFWFVVLWFGFCLFVFVCLLPPPTNIEYLDEAFILPRIPMFVTSSENTKVLKLLREGISTLYFISFRNVAQ